jgi:hypothetical protein
MARRRRNRRNPPSEKTYEVTFALGWAGGRPRYQTVTVKARSEAEADKKARQQLAPHAQGIPNIRAVDNPRRRRNRRNPSMESWMSQRLKSMDYPECDGNMNATAHYYMLMKEGNDQYPGEDLHELDYAVREALEGAYGKTYISPGVADVLEQEGISVEETDPTDWVRDAQSYAEAEQYLAEDNPLFGWGADPNTPKHYLVKSYRYGRRDRGYETKFKRPTKQAAMDYAKSLASEYVRLPQDHRSEIVVYAVYPSGKEQEVWTSYQPSKLAANNPRRAKPPTRKNTGHPKRRNAKLTAADKAKMPLRDFAIPKLRKFPMHTEAYGKKSIQYGQWKSNRHYLPDVKAAVFARYPSLISWWNENHPESPWKPGKRRAVSGRTALKQRARQHRSPVLIEKEIADLKRQIAAAKRERANPRKRKNRRKR